MPAETGLPVESLDDFGGQEAGADVQTRNGAALRLATIGGHSRTALFLNEWIRDGGSCQPEDRLRT
jgi:hypothetical protein